MSERDTRELRSRVARALEPAMERDAATAGPHPSVDELVRYHGGDLGEEAAERVQAHLVVCAECLESLLDLESFVAAGASGEGAEPGSVPAETERSRRSTVSSASGSRRVALALAASLLVAISTLAFWVVRERTAADDLRQQVAALSAPRPDVPIVDLFPDASVRRRPGDQSPTVVSAGEEYVTLVLNLPQAAEHDRFEAELVDSQGRVSWGGPLTRSRFGTLTLGLGRRSLSPGDNRLLLYGVDEAEGPGPGRRRLLETYSFRIEPSEEVK